MRLIRFVLHNHLGMLRDKSVICIFALGSFVLYAVVTAINAILGLLFVDCKI